MAEQVTFKSDTKYRKQWLTGLHFSHPAKMHLSLQLYLIDRYTKPGETILDPMAGSGTILVACSLGRNVICVELEQKFVDMQKGNWAKIRERGPQMGCTMGNALILQGDARNLGNVLADVIVTSPPYAGGGHHADQTGAWGGQAQSLTKDQANYGKSRGQIGNLPYGQIDAVITSPPYEGSVNVPDSKPEDRAKRLKNAGYDPKDYQGGTGRNLQQDWSYHPVDAVITSPPYEGMMESGRHAGGIVKRENLREDGGDMSLPVFYAESNTNIGNLKSASYLAAMLQIYENCFRILKPNGLMVLVLKNFIRDKKIVRLDEDTLKLCEQAGFSFVERLERRLTQQSFWRVIYAQRYPDSPKIEHEDVLVFRRG